MTVQNTPNFVDFVGNDVQTSFPFTFRVDDIAWLSVDFTDNFDQFLLNADQETSPGGSVEYTVAPPSPGMGGPDPSFRVLRTTAQTQVIDYARYDAFDSESHETALDKLTMQIQDQNTIDVGLQTQITANNLLITTGASPGHTHVVADITDFAALGGYFTSTAISRVKGLDSAPVNIADDIIVGGRDAALVMADTDFAGSIVFGQGAWSRAIGAVALASMVVIGELAMQNHTSAISGTSVVVGGFAAQASVADNTNALTRCVIVGYQAAERQADNPLSNATLVGYRAGRCNTANGFVNANGQTFIGALSGQNQQSAVNCTAVGRDTMSLQALTGAENSAFGAGALGNISSGSNNFAGGVNAGLALGTEDNVTIVGNQSVDIAAVGSRSTILGAHIDGSPNATDQIIIGYGAGLNIPGSDHGVFVVESTQSTGANRQSYLFGNTGTGNLVLGLAAGGGGVPINRDFGTGALNVFKIHDVIAGPTTAATGGSTQWSVGGRMQFMDGIGIRDNSGLDVMNIVNNGANIVFTYTGVAQVQFGAPSSFFDFGANVSVTGDLSVVGGNALQIFDGSAVDRVDFSHDGTSLFISEATGGTLHAEFGMNVLVDIQEDVAHFMAVLNNQGGVRLQVNNATGQANITQLSAARAVEDSWIQMDRNGEVRLYFNNIERFTTLAGGTAAIRSDGNTDTEARRLQFLHLDATLRAEVGFTGSDVLALINRIDGGNILIFGTNAGSASRSLVDMDPDGGVDLYHAAENLINARTRVASTGGFQARNTLTGAGIERVLTFSDHHIGATTAQLNDITNVINTSGEKTQGYMCFNSSTSQPVWAVGAADGSVWVDATGARAHTPV